MTRAPKPVNIDALRTGLKKTADAIATPAKPERARRRYFGDVFGDEADWGDYEAAEAMGCGKYGFDE